MTQTRYLCIHGHFYQPPRENPWLDVVEVQDSAAPFHDWNERIARECYAPNARSRLVDGQGRIINLINNYGWISFNFGPTLHSWLVDHAPEVHREIIAADRASRARRGGHGNALAQAYNHMILPLASPRDRRTQVLWGIADFRRRFGRMPEGMWLAETAVDTPTLEALAESGIKFTILAPSQARRWRELGTDDWIEAPGGIDPSRAYLARLPSGRSIALFFYDGIIAREVAFERLLDSGETFYQRLMEGFDDNRRHPQLMHIATDGESYGHHHPHGDMALAYVLDRIKREGQVRLTNYGEFLELHPPDLEVEIHERSAWSCAHGVGRWAEDCGCKMRGDWQQGWRAPLRKALDRLKGQLDHVFGTRGRECFPDPWAARDAYIDVIHDRAPKAVRAFLRRHGHPDLDEGQVRDALRLLEMQRDGMLMFTSCGWFFDEISGIETTQCLQYAARAIHLAGHFRPDLERRFVQGLKAAPSNLPQFRDGRGVWERLIRPSAVDLERVMAHCALGLIFPRSDADARSYAFDLDVIDKEIHARGGTHLAIGRLRVRARQTWDEAESAFVVIHYGGLDFHAVLRSCPPQREYEALKLRLVEAYRSGSLADVTTLAAREFPGRSHHLDDLFADEQRRLIAIVLQDRIEDYQRTFERLARQDDDVLNRLGRMHHPIPRPLRATAASYLDLRLLQELRRLEEVGDLELIQALIERGRAWGYQAEAAPMAEAIARALVRVIAGLGADSDPTAIVNRADQLLGAASLLALTPDLWGAQNCLLDQFVQLSRGLDLSPSLSDAFNQLADRLMIGRYLLGWEP